MNNQKGKINSLISPFWHKQMFFYFNQNGTAIAHSLLHPIIFFNNTLQTSFHVITLSSTLGYSDVTGYPWVFSNWGQSLFHFTLQKHNHSQKNQQALHISLKTLWAMEKRVALLTIQQALSNTPLGSSILSVVWLCYSPNTVSQKPPLALLVYLYMPCSKTIVKGHSSRMALGN